MSLAGAQTIYDNQEHPSYFGIDQGELISKRIEALTEACKNGEGLPEYSDYKASRHVHDYLDFSDTYSIIEASTILSNEELGALVKKLITKTIAEVAESDIEIGDF